MTQFHIQIGWSFVIIMILSTIGFFAFFGKVCTDHLAGKDPLDTCKKFSSEIFVTGLVILAITVIVGVTSFFRAKINYDIFYRFHLLVLAMYVMATIHTFDDEFRERTPVGKNRSQT